MLKQTMGTPYHNHPYRADNKTFKIMTPQKPMVRTETYSSNQCDLHPAGTNAVVAVITYTGYDMEDAMIINKSSYERGFGHGVIHKTKVITAAGRDAREGDMKNSYFSNTKNVAGLDALGLPIIGSYVTVGDPLYSYVDTNGDPHLEKYMDDEPCYIEQVTLIGGTGISGGVPCQRALLKLRYPRNPVVGDKFASRHGQKGVMSFLWPQEDMPWTESGITPDILFNPHGFPSRMTIGMLIESIAGKACALEGQATAEATTFRQYKGLFNNGDDNEGNPFPNEEGQKDERSVPKNPAEYFGHALKKHGYEPLGTEKMYSGLHGTEMEIEIFVGVVYYQRLRHLVMDKAQVRARGRNDQTLCQPVKGRKRHGGIRFGEMERDSLLAHGCAYLLHDRLMRCSDYDVAYVCPECKSIISPQADASQRVQNVVKNLQCKDGETWICPPCTNKLRRVIRCHPMPIPVVLRYLTCELAAMNIKMEISTKDQARVASLSKVCA